MRCNDFDGEWIKVDSLDCKRNKPLKFIYNLHLERVHAAITEKQLGNLNSTISQKIMDLKQSDIEAH